VVGEVLSRRPEYRDKGSRMSIGGILLGLVCCAVVAGRLSSLS
jgi:hypothetical protein